MRQQILTGSRRQLANLLGLSERRITDLVTAKILPPRGKAGFDLVAAVRGYVGFLKIPAGDWKAERTRYARLKADVLSLQLQKIQGTLVERAAVEKKLYELQRRNRDAISNIPSRLAGILAAESNQDVVFQLLTKELTQAMQRLAT